MRRTVVHDGKRIGHAEVRVLAHPHDEHEAGVGREAVEVVAVVEVTVAGADVAHGLRDLVDGEVVERRQARGVHGRIVCSGPDAIDRRRPRTARPSATRLPERSWMRARTTSTSGGSWRASPAWAWTSSTATCHRK